jgi:hypothetical protein
MQGQEIMNDVGLLQGGMNMAAIRSVALPRCDPYG